MAFAIYAALVVPLNDEGHELLLLEKDGGMVCRLLDTTADSFVTVAVPDDVVEGLLDVLHLMRAEAPAVHDEPKRPANDPVTDVPRDVPPPPDAEPPNLPDAGPGPRPPLPRERPFIHQPKAQREIHEQGERIAEQVAAIHRGR